MLPIAETWILPPLPFRELQQAEFQLDAAASGIVRAGTDSPNGANLDVVDLSSEMVALMSAQTL